MKVFYPLTVSLSLLFVFLTACGNDSPEGEEQQGTDCFAVNQKEHVIQSDGGELLVEFVKHDAEVSALSSAGWCKPFIITRDGKDYVQLMIDPHTGESARSAGVILSSARCPNIELTIRQEGISQEEDPDDGERLAFKVSSYNIRYASAADVETGNGWDVRKPYVANIIKNHDFDIVGTQEGNVAQLTDLKGLLPGYDYVGHPYGGSNHNLHNCAIFYKTGKYDVLETGVFWFSETPDIPSIGWDATDRRICFWAKFKDKGTDLEFYFFTAHFYYQFQTAKQNSGPLMAAKVKEIAGDAPAIATGDYNSRPNTSQVYAILTQLKDAYDITETPPAGPADTNLGGGNFFGEPNGRIDYIFVSNHFKVLNFSTLIDSYGSEGRYPSDHLPITAKLSIALD